MMMSDTAMTGIDWRRLPEDYGKQYERLDAKYAHIYRASAARLAELASVRPGQTVIDIGAGTGISTEAVWSAMAGRGRVMAIDPSGQMLSQIRAKYRLGSALIRQGTAADVANLAGADGFVGQTDAVISSFTYYYTYEARGDLHAAVRGILRPGGRWCFNLTRYLGELRINGKLYNEFGEIYLTHLARVAAAHGIELSRKEADEDLAQFTEAGVEAHSIRSAGFGEVAVEAWPLPLSPSEAYHFTIDGFYRYGSRTTFAPELMKASVEARVAILEEALDECRDEIDAGRGPYIANFSAIR
jgi:ubiquinone/menaquinone biosynthesis C-methylase UbiE